MLLRSRCSKPSAPLLSARDGSDLTRDVDKLHRWTEHFAEVVNCGVNFPHTEKGSNAPKIKELCANPSEEEIPVAISQLIEEWKSAGTG